MIFNKRFLIFLWKDFSHSSLHVVRLTVTFSWYWKYGSWKWKILKIWFLNVKDTENMVPESERALHIFSNKKTSKSICVARVHKLLGMLTGPCVGMCRTVQQHCWWWYTSKHLATYMATVKVRWGYRYSSCSLHLLSTTGNPLPCGSLVPRAVRVTG